MSRKFTDREILVVSPPDVLGIRNLLSYELGQISGLLKRENIGFTQKSLFLDCIEKNYYRFWPDRIDLSVFQNKTLMNDYFGGNNFSIVGRKARKIASDSNLGSYDIIIGAVHANPSFHRGFVNFLALSAVLKQLEDDKTLIIAGSCSFGDIVDFGKHKHIDYFIDGDYERPLVNILEHEINGEDLTVENGIITRFDDEIVRSEPYRHEIEEKPPPYFSIELLQRLESLSLLDGGIVRYRFGRGCKNTPDHYNCIETDFSEYKSVEKALKEIKQISEYTGASYLRFCDNHFFNDPEKVLRLSESLESHDIGLEWSAKGRIVDRGEDYFDKLSSGGCSALHFDVDSFSDSVLERMGKSHGSRKIKNVSETARQKDIKPFAYLTSGFFNETAEEHRENLEFIRHSNSFMGAEVSKQRILSTANLPKIEEEYNIEVLSSEKPSDDRIFNLEIDYREKSGKSFKRQDTIKEKRRKILQRNADLHLFLGNYGRNYPAVFSRKMLMKLYSGNFNDISYSFA